MENFLKKYGALVLVIFFLVLSIVGTFIYFDFDIEVLKEKEEQEVDSLFLTVNGIEVTRDEVETYEQEVAHEFLTEEEENLTSQAIRKEATERAVRRALVLDYFSKIGVKVSEEEIEDELRRVVRDYPGVEREEEFFRITQMGGYSPEQVKRDIKFLLLIEKALEKTKEDVEIENEEEVSEKYEEYRDFYGEESLDLEEVRDDIVEMIKKEKANEILLEELGRIREEAEIVFYD